MKYEYGVEYETNGEKPDLPRDVKVEVKNKSTKNWYGGSDFACQYVIWENILSFRIVDERYKPNANDWHERGELPPVGTECEYYDRIKESWDKANIVAHHANTDEAIWSYQPNGGQLFYGSSSDFRPLRTERDVLVEKGMRAFVEYKEEHPTKWSATDLLCALYDAGMLTEPKGE